MPSLLPAALVRSGRLGAAVFATAATLAVATSAQPDDPFKPAPPKEVKKVPPTPGKIDPDDPFAPGAAARAPKDKAAWGGRGGAIPVESSSPVTFGPPGCMVAVVGSTVWDLKEGKPGQQLVGGAQSHSVRALSADGKYFAAGSKSANQTDTTVTVWSTETGQRVLDVPGDKKAFVDLLHISRNKYLLVGGRHAATIDVWDLETGKVAKQLTGPDRRVESDKIAFTADGKYFATVAHDRIVVTATATNKEAAVMAPPGGDGAPPPVAPRVVGKKGAPKAVPAPRNTKIDTIFLYTHTHALAFSPDGTELAAFSTHPAPRLLVWNTKGQLLMDEPVPMPRTVGIKNNLEWMPDGSGWLVNGNLYDRTSRRVLMALRSPFGSDVLPHLIDREKIIGMFGNDRTRVQTVEVPWPKLTAALQAMKTKGGSYLAPGESVGLDLELAGLRGDEEQTRQVLAEALTKRLARDGITLSASSPTRLRLKLEEQAGEQLPIFERQTPFDFRGKDTGRKATEAKGAAVLEIVTKGEDQPLWRGHLTAMSSRSFKEEITDATVRKSMLEHLARQLSGMDIPYFIPRSKDVVALPAVVE